MKKILLTTAAVAVLASSSAYAMEDMFYVKANAGWSKLTKVHGLKSENGAFFGVGAGYYVMENVRAEVIFDHFVNPTHKGTRTVDNVNIEGFNVNGVKFNGKVKGEINTLMLNGFVDLFDVDAAKLFVGAGVGASQVKTKATGVATINGANVNVSAKAKQKYNLAFAGYVGGSYEFIPGVTGELTYSYRDMGKTKKIKDIGNETVHYKGHHVGVGVRFDI